VQEDSRFLGKAMMGVMDLQTFEETQAAVVVAPSAVAVLRQTIMVGLEEMAIAQSFRVRRLFTPAEVVARLMPHCLGVRGALGAAEPGVPEAVTLRA
jgi:hypothetical protein